MQKDKSEEVAINARIQEANNLGERLRDNMKTIDNANNIGLAVITAGVSFGVTQNEPVVLILMPIVLIVVVVHCVQTFTELLMMGGQRRCLEEVLREELGEFVLFSETVVAPLRVGALDLTMQQGLYGLLLLTLTAFGISQALDHLSGVWQAVYYAGIVYGLVTLAVSLKRMATAYDDAYAAASSALTKSPPPSP